MLTEKRRLKDWVWWILERDQSGDWGGRTGRRTRSRAEQYFSYVMQYAAQAGHGGTCSYPGNLIRKLKQEDKKIKGYFRLHDKVLSQKQTPLRKTIK